MDDISRAAAPALQQWPFTEDDAHQIPPPALVVLGAATPAMLAGRRELLLRWPPSADPSNGPA